MSFLLVQLLTGEPEYLDPLGAETPEGWIVTGYPVTSDISPDDASFKAAYKAKFNALPKMGSVVGYALIHAIAAGIVQAGGTDTDAMATRGFPGAAFNTPFGRAIWRAIDHQSTLGTFVGRTALKDGHGVMVDWHYVDGASALPSDAEVRTLRPA